MSESPIPERRRLGRRELLARLAPSKGGAGHWIRVHRPAMACRFEVTLPSEDARHVAAAREALDEVDALEAALTVFRETSELVRVNREAAAGPVEVTPGLFALLRLCRDLHAATAGAFDPTSTPLSRGWGFLAREGRQPAPEEIAEARNLVGMEKVELGEAERTVRFTTPGVELNLGAIGKGWALDRVAGSLRARGVSRALLSAGGSSLLGWGNEVWELALRPGGAGFGTLRLRDAALGTSGAGEQHFEQDGRRFGHVLDPRAGWPAEGVWSASVVADEAAVADALATALLVGGPEAAEALCASRPGTMAILVLESRKGQMLLFGRRDGVEIDPAPGVGVVEEV